MQQSSRTGMVDETMSLDEAIAASDVVVLAIPVDTVVTLLPKVLDKIDQQIVIDLGSTKSQLIDAVKKSSKERKICSNASDVGNGVQRSASSSKRRV